MELEGFRSNKWGPESDPDSFSLRTWRQTKGNSTASTETVKTFIPAFILPNK